MRSEIIKLAWSVGISARSIQCNSCNTISAGVPLPGNTHFTCLLPNYLREMLRLWKAFETSCLKVSTEIVFKFDNTNKLVISRLAKWLSGLFDYFTYKWECKTLQVMVLNQEAFQKAIQVYSNFIFNYETCKWYL